jgi:photosystem II oxygen-evolving enhancer protein 2
VKRKSQSRSYIFQWGQFGQRAIALILVLVSIGLVACSDSNLPGSYISATYGYQFLYPNGWIPVNVEDNDHGVDVVYRDLLEYSENLSVIVSDVPASQTLQSLGSPTDVGYRFMQEATTGDRQPELIRAESHNQTGQTYYTLEYQVTLGNGQQRHDLATVAIKQGKLYTFNLSTPQGRWQARQSLFNQIINSFQV